MWEEDWRKAKTSETKTNSIVFDIARKGRNSVLYYNFQHEFVPMKRSQESSSPFFSLKMKASTCCLVSQHSVSVRQNSSSKPQKIRWVRDTLKCELGKKEVWTPNVVLVSELRESRVLYGSEDSGDPSLRDACFGKPRSTNKKSFIPSNVDCRWKRENGIGMKGGHKEGTQKQKVRKVHFDALMDIRHIQKVRVHPGECSQEQSQVWKVWKFKLESLTKWLVDGCHQWKVSRWNPKSSSSTSTISEYSGMSYMNFDGSWIMNYRSSLREKEDNCDNLCCESSQPTVECHE